MHTPASSAATVFLAVMCMWQPASAQSRHTFDLDVPAGRFSSWTIEDVDKANMLEAELEVVELRRDGRWLPVFTVLLGADDRAIGLRMSQAASERDVGVSMIAFTKDQVTDRKNLDGWRIVKGKRFRLALDWSAAGRLVVSSEGIELGAFRREFDPTSLKITVSTGELTGHRLVLAAK